MRKNLFGIIISTIMIFVTVVETAESVGEIQFESIRMTTAEELLPLERFSDSNMTLNMSQVKTEETERTTKTETSVVNWSTEKMTTTTTTLAKSTTTSTTTTTTVEAEGILSKDEYLERVTLPQYVEADGEWHDYANYWVTSEGKVILKRGRSEWQEEFATENLPEIIRYEEYLDYCKTEGIPSDYEFYKIFVYRNYADSVE